MAEIIGYLREDRATHGEELILEQLRTQLPDTYTVYVECPLCWKDIERNPDFVVVAPYGVTVLEVKDWVQLGERVDQFGVDVWERGGSVRREKNPVAGARDCATLLASKMQDVPQLLNESGKPNVAWGYAVVFPNLPYTVISKLRQAWGEPHVFGRQDIDQRWAEQKIKATLPASRVRPLQSHEIRCIRAVINPVVFIPPVPGTKPGIVLDDGQQKIVSEPPARKAQEPRPAVPQAQQLALAPEAIAEPEPAVEDELPPLERQIVLNASIRLVRGTAGSGKTLVLTRRAIYLSAQNPGWRMCVLTYNDKLAHSLAASLRGCGRAKVTTFYKLCTALLKDYVGHCELVDAAGWLHGNLTSFELDEGLDADFLGTELRWIKDMALTTRPAYLSAERRGRGLALPLTQREQVYTVAEAYQAYLTNQGIYDWGDVPYLVLRGMQEQKIQTCQYDAILIDEAQDFAPVWLRVIRQLLNPEGGLLFLADDPSQSIYRYFSWRDKGIPVVGRTRWLRVPYRNTREIYEAAYAVIRDDEMLKRQMEQEMGTAIVEPDLSNRQIRSGPRPDVRCYSSLGEEAAFLESEIRTLLQSGTAAEQIAVLHRRTPGVRRLKEHLKGLGVVVDTFHALKGLEFEHVFLVQMQEAFVDHKASSPEGLSEERRLVYMAMTRARQRLCLTYEGHWPQALQDVLAHADHIRL